jgi:beta-mannanase
MVKITSFKTRKVKVNVGRAFFTLLTAILVLSVLKEDAKSASQVSSSASILKITHGAYIRPTLQYGQEIAAFNSLVQKNVGAVLYFLDWSVAGQNGFYFDTFLSDKIYQTFGANSPAIILTWQPMNGKMPGCTKNYGRSMPLSEITAGACDNYIRHFAREIKVRPQRYLIRFGHEMNISDTPWWPGNYGQDARAYVQMYRHVYNVFMSENVTNVEWVWSPNMASYPVVAWNERNQYYPGDEYVNWIAMSGLNWNTPWYWFTDIYDSSFYSYSLKDAACRYAKPQLLAEFGSVEGPGGDKTKAAWIADAYQKIPQYPFMRGVFWFNDSGAVDFRVTTVTGSGTSTSVYPLPTSTGTWTNSYKQAIANPIYNSSLLSIQEATPPTTYCGNGETVYTANPLVRMIEPGQNSAHNLIGMLFDQNVTLSAIFPPGSNLSGTFEKSVLSAPWDKTTLTIYSTGSTPLGSYYVPVQANGVTFATLQIQVVSDVYDLFLPAVKNNN